MAKTKYNRWTGSFWQRLILALWLFWHCFAAFLRGECEFIYPSTCWTMAKKRRSIYEPDLLAVVTGHWMCCRGNKIVTLPAVGALSFNVLGRADE